MTKQSEPRPSFYLDSSNGGSDLAGETAAALAAGSMAFKTKGEINYIQGAWLTAHFLAVFFCVGIYHEDVKGLS